MCALEGRGRIFALGFAAGCGLSSIYGFMVDAWPFGIVELGWAGAALRRYQRRSGHRTRTDALTLDQRALVRPMGFVPMSSAGGAGGAANPSRTITRPRAL